MLCKSASKRALDLCVVCEGDLPRLGQYCKICALPLPLMVVSESTCGSCLKRPPAFTRVEAPYLYQSPLDQLLWRFKFGGELATGQVLGRLLARYLKAHSISEVDMIVPVGLHWRRQFGRGFNQARELAVIVGKILNIPVSSRVIQRTTHTPAQQGLNRRERQRNLHRSFAVKSTAGESLIKGKVIAIMDDIVTTGSTADAIAKLLIKNGARQVVIWAVARTPLDR